LIQRSSLVGHEVLGYLSNNPEVFGTPT